MTRHRAVQSSHACFEGVMPTFRKQCMDAVLKEVKVKIMSACEIGTPSARSS